MFGAAMAVQHTKTYHGVSTRLRLWPCSSSVRNSRRGEHRLYGQAFAVRVVCSGCWRSGDAPRGV